jgi:acetyl esterase/lipase
MKVLSLFASWIVFVLLLLTGFLAHASAQESGQVIPLWRAGAPGFEAKRDIPELAESYWVKNIHNPSVTAFFPDSDKATGAAVIICPGGGHRELVFNAEGVEAAKYLNSIGVTAFALKYRLGREPGLPYTIEEHGLADGQRAVRLVRGRAAEWGIDPTRIGMLGFSAGGEIVSMVAYADPKSAGPSDDNRPSQCTAGFSGARLSGADWHS